MKYFEKKRFFITALLGVILIALNVKAQTTTTTSTFPIPAKVESESEWRPHAAVLLGVVNPEGDYQAAAEYGVDIGFQPDIPFGIGAELTFSNSESDSQDDLERTTVLAKGTYNFGGTNEFTRHTYVGLGMGPVFRSDGTDFAVAPLAGVDFPLDNKDHNFLSIGANAKYTFVSGNDFDAFALNGVVKYWY